MCNLGGGQYNYTGGNCYSGGDLQGPWDYWFREGIVVPEPSSIPLLVLGGCSLVWFKKRKKPEAS